MDRTTDARRELDAAEGNFRIHVHALTQQVLRQGSSLMTQAEARAEALRLYRSGIRAGVAQ